VIGDWSVVSGQWSVVIGDWSLVIGKTTDNGQRTTNNCTGEAFGELFLAMTDNLSSKCFAPTNN
jgi:hypothetical protein